MSLVTEKMNSYIADIQDKLVKKGRPVIAEMFKATYLNTIDTTVKMDEHGAFVITGDIPAEHLLDFCLIAALSFLLFILVNRRLKRLL